MIIKTTLNILFLKAKFQHIILFSALLLLASACSLKKNTPATRAYQALNTRYNVHFNGLVSYNEGLQSINTAHREDYSSVIPMYPISRHENANAAKSAMDRTIEKCRKAIKLHSIKQKPERDDKKWSDPQYQLWYKQEEFNPALKDAWLLLAQAEFHKGDFIGSVGTFTYIARHYSTDKDMVARCQLWTARAYGEMGWIYEAEQLLSKLKQDDLNATHIGLFASVNADLLVKKHQYKEAIPFLELALKKENNKYQKQRFQFLLAQLYKITGNNEQAFQAFSNVLKLNPPFEMDFNARIYRAELDNEHVNSVRKELNKMLKNQNNKDYLDQIYYTIGKTYLQTKDTTKAIEYFIESKQKSTRNGFDKAVTLITLGDLYYNKQNYIMAQPCYDEASKIITVDNENYNRVSKLAETLGELVTQHDIVVLQDSLQHLSTLPEDKRLEIVNKIIDKLKADEKASIEAEQTKSTRGFDPEDELNNMPVIGQSAGMGNWYFYNAAILKTGQSDFVKRWGKRKLEDNWRRSNKSSALFAEETVQNNTDATSAAPKDSTKQSNVVSDNKNPEFYLQQIPVTPAQIEKSNSEIATALFNMGMIYKDKVEDFTKAIDTFDEFNRRFPLDERRVETYFQSYMLESKQGNLPKADYYKNLLITNFPKSKYVEVISMPDYFDRMNRMYHEQDSIYNNTYTAYNNSDFKSVKQNVEYIKKNYPLSTLMPKFMFLNALSIGKTEKPETFELALNEVVEKFPDSDVSAMSKDILSLMKQGLEAKTGKSHGTLLARRENDVKEEYAATTEKQFSIDKSNKHRLLIVTKADIKSMNKLLYNIAAYNFSSFIVKDFDLATGKLDSINNALSVINFDSYDEVQWYINSMAKNPSLMSLIEELNTKEIIISEENYGILRSVSGLSQYLSFQSSILNNTNLAENVKTVSGNAKQEKNIKKPVVKPDVIAKTNTTTSTENLNKLDENALNEVNKANEKQVLPPDTKESVVSNETKQAQVNTPAAKTPEPTTTPVRTIQPTVPAVVVPKEEEVPLFKNLFAYRANEPHFVSIVVLSGEFDFVKLKSAFDTYNAQNYSMLNLKINKENVAGKQIIIIDQFADANTAKSYLLRMVKERSLFENLKGTDYRNLLGSQKNLNIMMQKDAMTTYFEFMQQYYLK